MATRTTHRLLYIVALVASGYVATGNSNEKQLRSLVMSDGVTVAATIEALRSDWSIEVSAEGVTKSITATEYTLWGTYSDDDRSSQVLLTDDTVIVGDIVRIEDESVTLASRLWGDVRIDRRLVRACLVLPAADPLDRDRQWRSLRDDQAADRVALVSNDAISGRLLPTTERDGGGLFGLVSIGIELPGGEVTTSVNVEEISAISFRHRAPSASPTNCVLGFNDGSLISASRLTRSESGLTEIVTASGASLQLSSDAIRERLTLLQPRNERVAYLSDLPAVGFKSIPFLQLEWPLGIATNTLGGRLRNDGKIVLKGLGMHSTSRVAYNLDGNYQSFQADLALDDHAGDQGSVVYRVLVERTDESGAATWKLDFTSPIVRGGEPSLPVALDITGATRMALIVEMADRVDTRDYANWLHARVVVN